MKKKIYKWHRTLSLIIAIPVILWAASGFMHPLMTNIRPKIATQGIAPVAIDSSMIRLNLEQALLQNGIDSFCNVRLVHIDTNWFYQVQKKYNAIPDYLSVKTGKLLKRGDWLYAQYLAKIFLEGNQKDTTTTATGMPVPDCCDAASICVLKNTKGSQVTDAVRLTAFDNEYKSINRLLPVYKVNFDRADGIRVYVETTQDRFAFAMDNRRAAFDTFFRLVHTWAWLDLLGKGKYLVEFLLVSLAFITTLMGVYIFFTTKSKKVNGNGLVKARRNHRYTAIVVALFTLMFTFSSGYHALSKLQEDTRDRFYAHPLFAAKDIRFSLPALMAAVKKPVINIGLVQINGKNYWQVFEPAAGKSKTGTGKDLMKSMQVAAPQVDYVSTGYTTILPDGEASYARYLATLFSGHPESSIRSVQLQTRFDNEYNFTDKRLPVWKVDYNLNGHERWYVETSTGRLSVMVNNSELAEGYSFATLHKHEFMGWGGKTLKDISTMFWAASQIIMVTIGLVLYVKWRNKKRATAK